MSESQNPLTRTLLHRIHAARDRRTLCGHDVRPSRWIELGQLTLIFQLTCQPCMEEIFKRNLIQPDGSIGNG